MSAPSLERLDTRGALVAAAESEIARRRLGDFIALLEPSYERPPHARAICEHLEAVENEDVDRLIVQTPPRVGKTLHVSMAYPAWTLGRNPRSQIVLASYGAELAEGNSRKARAYMRSDRWPFKCRVSEESRAQNRWQTDAGGILIATGCEGGLTGYGADRLIIDDPIRDRADAESEALRERLWSWYTDVARTRLMTRGRIVICQTRWHSDDLVSRILNSGDAKRWTVLSLPAICEDEASDPLHRNIGEALWPERFPIEALPSVERGEISSRSFAALYQQRPVPAEGNVFKASWFEYRYDELPPLKFTGTALDAAAKTGVANDFSAIATIGTDGVNWYILDMVRERLEFFDLGRRLIRVNERFKSDRTWIEDASAGTPLVSELRRSTNLAVIGVPPRGTKIARAEAVSGLFEAGKVLLPKDAPWVDAFIEEFLRFPASKHDDQVDAVSLCLERLRQRQRRETGSWFFFGSCDGSEASAVFR